MTSKARVWILAFAMLGGALLTSHLDERSSCIASPIQVAELVSGIGSTVSGFRGPSGALLTLVGQHVSNKADPGNGPVLAIHVARSLETIRLA